MENCGRHVKNDLKANILYLRLFEIFFISSGLNEIFARHGLAYRRQQSISKSMMLMEIKNGYL